MTTEEIEIVRELGYILHLYLELPGRPTEEFCAGIRVLQDKILARSGRRAINA